MKHYCHKCNETLDEIKIPRCPKCGQVYELIYKYDDYSHILKEILCNHQISHWKYHSLMPIKYHNIPNVITMHEGNTPLMRKLNLRPNNFLGDLYFKCEYLNPTGSFKDRASALEVTLAQGYDEIIVATTGNMGASLATYAAFTGIKCKIFIPSNIHNNKIDQMKMCGAEVITINGDYTDTMVIAEQYYLEHPNSYLAGDYGIRVEGTKSVGFEICEQLEWEVPDYIIIPVGNGTLLWAIFKAFDDLKEIGIINKLPKIIGVKSDNPEITNVSAIACPKPNAEYIVSKIVEKIIDVTDEQIMNAREILAKNGFFVEPAGATAYAGLRKVNIDGTAIVLLTGNGMKGI